MDIKREILFMTMKRKSLKEKIMLINEKIENLQKLCDHEWIYVRDDVFSTHYEKCDICGKTQLV